MPIEKKEIFNEGSKKILIIEDEEALASILSSKFKVEGFNVLVSSNGQDGLEQIEKWRPDLILLDIVMPKMNGYEVLEEMNKKNIKIPAIIISNSGQDVELEKAKKLGAEDFIIKTQIDPGEVVVKVNKFLNIGVKHETMERQEKSNGVKVLLVEDDVFLRDICCKKLKKEGFNVLTAADGEEALRKIESFLPEIVLLDIILPSTDGFEVLTAIRSHRNKAIKDVPVFMLTNLGQEEDINKALELGASDYLIKAHFTTEEIVKKIKNKLSLK